MLGCGFCEKAKALLNDLNNNPTNEFNSFSIKIIYPTNIQLNFAIKTFLNLNDMSYPQIIIRGRYIGGYDDLFNLTTSNSFEPLLQMNSIQYDTESISIVWHEPLLLSSQSPNLLHTPNSSKWYCFQWYLYSNLIRYISIFHVLLFSLLLILIPILQHQGDQHNSNLYLFLQSLVIILLFDIFMIIILGPSPFSISGIISTYYCWKYKGNITSSLPYKFVWSIYFFSLISILLKNNLTSTGTIATITSILTNSILLVVFRF